ncbi:MAG: MoxR family ATPase [Deltaproteobacteria bacterium]|nr:MoxR family ATPase [Deltaproteobacteria bacterium]MBW1847453.1 MoxR family ATPase [Deltaproteobacteria bacterium]MBW1983460.1 MoxR family ATPase [Deltaproteobacteria bacterium]MBW2180415.1 MoxR family ATPase [Deltaproteobacteria bacterium]
MEQKYEDIVQQIGTVILGKEKQIRLALTCLFAQGHLLIEDMPGIGKTTLAKVLSVCLGLSFRRIQCTSDMLPGDILGVSVFEQKSGSFIFHPGPIFTHVLLSDEINRATPKTQSALLEAMEEQQVTVEGKTRRLEEPFFVIATQNPFEYSGTFPLPESQLDRFLMRIEIGYPGRQAEHQLLKGDEPKSLLAKIKPCLDKEEVLKIQRKISGVHVSDAMLEYLQDILDFTRRSPHFYMGLSPRAGMALLQTAKSWSFLHGRDYALPEDLQQILPWVIGHRLRSKDDLQQFSNEKINAFIMEVPIP